MDRDRIRRFYDRMGRKQDSQGFYEDAAIAALRRSGDFGSAQSVLEVGCGTGKLAARLLSDHLPDTARYVGIDISGTMVRLARARISYWKGRAAIRRSEGDFDLAPRGADYDRVVFAYVFDLLDAPQIDAALAGAHAVLLPGGLLCAAGLTEGTGPLSRATMTLWRLVHRVSPDLVGGCRPLVLADRLTADMWRILYRQVVVRAAIPSEVIVAEAIRS